MTGITETDTAYAQGWEDAKQHYSVKLAELLAEGLDNPTSRMVKVIKAAEDEGWTTGRITICVRLSRPDDKPSPRVGAVAFPFYATWELRGWTPTGKPSWGFVSACTAALQPLSEQDIFAYLADPSVVLPEPPPEGETE